MRKNLMLMTTLAATFELSRTLPDGDDRQRAKVEARNAAQRKRWAKEADQSRAVVEKAEAKRKRRAERNRKLEERK